MTGYPPYHLMSTKSTAPAPMEAPATPDANSLAAQIKNQLGNKVTVIASGSALSVTPKYGLSEQDMGNLKVTVPATSVPPRLTGISFSVKDAQGNTVDLEDSDPAASSYYAFNFKQSASTAYNAALRRGDAYYTVNLPQPAVIDSITKHFNGEHTLNRQKIVTAFTIDCDPTKVYNGDKGGPYFNQ